MYVFARLLLLNFVSFVHSRLEVEDNYTAASSSSLLSKTSVQVPLMDAYACESTPRMLATEESGNANYAIDLDGSLPESVSCLRRWWNTFLVHNCPNFSSHPYSNGRFIQPPWFRQHAYPPRCLGLQCPLLRLSQGKENESYTHVKCNLGCLFAIGILNLKGEDQQHSRDSNMFLFLRPEGLRTVLHYANLA